jgi:electron transport complex protein RnfG
VKKAFEMFKPALALMTVCLVVCGLLVFVYELTYVDTTGIITDKLEKALSEIYGTNHDEAAMLTDKNDELVSYTNVLSVIKCGDGYAFETITSGYSKNSLHLLIGLDSEGKVAGIAVISSADTKSLWNKVGNSAHFSKYHGAENTNHKVDAVTGVTMSSRGIKAAVDLALTTYAEHKDEY